MKSAIILILVAMFVVNSDAGWFGKGAKALKKALTNPIVKKVVKHTAKTVFKVAVGDVRTLREMNDAEMDQMLEAIKMIRDMDEDEFNDFENAQSVEDLE